MNGTCGHIGRLLRRSLPLLALLIALVAPTLAEARGSGGHAPGRGSVPARSNTTRIGVRQVTGGGITPATPPPIPPPASTAIPTVQQIRNNALAPAGIGSPVASTASPEASTDEPTRTNANRNTSGGRTAPFIVAAVVLMLAAGSAITIGGFFALCRSVRRHERERFRGAR
jgi:hypothetical protein